MDATNRNLPLSRGQWTLARYLAERSPAPMPPVAVTIARVDELMMGVGMYWENYFDDDKELYHKDFDRQRLAQKMVNLSQNLVMSRLIRFPTNSFSGALLDRLLDTLKWFLLFAGKRGQQCRRRDG